jgi:PHP family Zn ribbon phosphoesterase
MGIVADLHLHSKYARAVSKDMVLLEIEKWAEKKGIGLVATGDWMHPLWFRELERSLKEDTEGLYTLKDTKNQGKVKFLLSSEISSIYTFSGKSRRVHTLIFSPSISVCERINHELIKRGCNLSSDGRPIVGLSVKDIAEISLSISQKCLVIPAHVWTPWYGLYGASSGFLTLEECFGELVSSVFAVETGLSSDPAMNWSIKELEKRAILSFSDAHSGAKIAREATVFRYRDADTSNGKITYDDVYWAIAERSLGENKGHLEIDSTIEFHPEEGKYHYSGHRKCGIIQSPVEDVKQGAICTVCGKALTLGVMHRVMQLSRTGKGEEGELIIEPKKKINEQGVAKYYHPIDKGRPSYVMAVPLLEILAEVQGKKAQGIGVLREYERLVKIFGSEYDILLNRSISEIESSDSGRLGEAIKRVRKGNISVQPGYDGVFGVVKIWKDEQTTEKAIKKQMSLF